MFGQNPGPAFSSTAGQRLIFTLTAWTDQIIGIQLWCVLSARFSKLPGYCFVAKGDGRLSPKDAHKALADLYSEVAEHLTDWDEDNEEEDAETRDEDEEID